MKARSLCIFSTLLFFTTQASFALKCPESTTLVALELPSSGDKLEFCQKNFDGEILKHGPYKRTSADGVVLEDKYFTRGELGKHPIKKVVPKKSNNECEEMKKMIKWALNPTMANKTEEHEYKTHRRITTDPRLCRGYPRKRLNFIIKGIPFNNVWKFKEKCHIEGVMKLKEGISLHAKYKTRPPFLVDTIEFDYLLKRFHENNSYSLVIEATNGKMTKAGRTGSIDFSFTQKFSINLADLKSSGGREGTYSEEPIVTITKAFDQSCSI